MINEFKDNGKEVTKKLTPDERFAKLKEAAENDPRFKDYDIQRYNTNDLSDLYEYADDIVKRKKEEEDKNEPN